MMFVASKDISVLIQLTIEQVSKLWHRGLREAIVTVLPPFKKPQESVIDHVIYMLLTGRMVAWVVVENEQILSVGTTIVVHDYGTGEDNLLIYTLYGQWATEHRIKAIQDMLNSLESYARKKKCSHIMAYSNVSSIVKLANLAGFDTETRLLKKSVEE